MCYTENGTHRPQHSLMWKILQTNQWMHRIQYRTESKGLLIKIMVSHFIFHWERLLIHVSTNASLVLLFLWDWLIWNSERHHGKSKDFVILFMAFLSFNAHSYDVKMCQKCVMFFFHLFFPLSHLRKLYLDEEKIYSNKKGKLPTRWRLPIFPWNIINVKCILISDVFFSRRTAFLPRPFDWS